MKKALACILSLLMILAPVLSVYAEGEPTVASATRMTELPKTGDRVIIYNTANNKALDACETNGYYNAGVGITPVDGVLTGIGESIVWDVTKNADGTYRFSQNGKFLSMGASYTSTPYDEVNRDWTVQTHGDGYSIKNTARNLYLKWYASKQYFNAYQTIDNTGAFDFLFYKLEGTIVKAPVAAPDGAGVILPGTKVALTCETEGAAIFWRFGGQSAFTEYTAPITVSESCSIYTYAQVGNSVSETVAIAYTVGETETMSIPQALAAGEVPSAKVVGQLVYRFGNFGNINSAILQAKIDDEVYALQCYNSLNTDDAGNPIEIGDWLVLSGKLGAYGGVQQIMSLTGIRKAQADEIIGGNATEPQVFESFAEITENHADLLSEYVLIKNVTLGEYKDNGSTTVTDSTGATMTVYRAAKYPVGVQKGDVVNLYAAVSQYNTTKQLRNGSSKDYIPTNDTKGPVITRVNMAEAEVGNAYNFTVNVRDASGVARVAVQVLNGGNAVMTFEGPDGVEDDIYRFLIPGTAIFGGNLTVRVTATDMWETPNQTVAEFELVVIDLPQITGFTPEANSATEDNKRPVISVSFANSGENPTVEMKLNNTEVTPVVRGNTATYTPTTDMEDGKVNVCVRIVREDGASYEISWSFTVGAATYRLYFGELHSHTAEYSDGTGTLEQALAHAKAAEQISFLAVTDHSNYFDTKDNPNGDLTDAAKGKLTADGSMTLWQEARTKAAAYADADFIPIIGYEMTWSGQYGHMNTFNSIGFESRNASKYVVKGGQGLVAYYERLAEVARIDRENGRKTVINQFNHPGTTFGTFEDFAHYSPAYDELITMIEVGNGEGKVGGSMYWPSYQYYTMALDKGWHLAPTNNQDNHKGGWGDSNTCRDVIYTDNFSEEGIYDAMRSMAIYATEDNDLEIYYTLNGNVMGSVLNLGQDETLTIRVDFKDPTDKVQKVSVIANGGVTVASKTFNAQSGSWEIALDNRYSYYYVRVDEVDADIAVTAPVWTSEKIKIGMSPVEKDTVIELRNEPITFSIPLYNYEEAAIGEDASAVAFTITGAEYSINGAVVATEENPTFADGTNVLKPGKTDDRLTWEYTPAETGRFRMEVSVTGTFRGTEYVFSGSMGFTVRDGADMALMLIDAGHSNFYVSEDYADYDAAFIELAAQYGVKAQHITEPITDAVLENCDLLVLTVPFKGAGVSVGDSLYTADEIAAIGRYAARGGSFIVCSKSDRLEPSNEAEWASNISNTLLNAIGAKARVGKGIVSDAVNMTGESFRLHFTGKSFYNWNVPLTEDLIEHTNLMFSCYNAAPIILNGAESAVNAFDTTFVSSYPLFCSDGKTITPDQTYQPYYDACGDQDIVSVLAYEELPGGGFCVTSGVTFFSKFEVKVEMESAATLQNANFQIVVNLLKMIRRDKVTPIAEIHEAGKLNTAYTIEGYVTSNASGYDKDTAFFDCIYIEDESGRGINVFPVSGRYEVGQKLRVTGMTSEYMGEIELNCGNDYGGEIRDITLRDVEYTEDGVTTTGYATRARLTEVEIVMADMQTIETFTVDESALDSVIDGICAENRRQYVIPETIATGQASSPEMIGNLVAFAGRITGIEYDANGVVGAIRVDDGTGEATVFLDGYINCSDNCFMDEQGYHNLSWIKEGVYVSVRGIASVGQNSYETPDRIGPRIRMRDRADIVKFAPRFGDANCDGRVTSTDAAFLLRVLVGLSRLKPEGMINANVAPDFDGMPDAADAVAILRYIVGLIKVFEVEETQE